MAAHLKRIVCLANSRRPGGTCVAGKEQLPNSTFGGWIRPVGAGDSHSLRRSDRQYADRGEPQVLDIVELSLSSHAPFLHQVENHTIDSGYRWRRAGRFPFEALSSIADDAEELWLNGYHSYNGMNDRVPTDLLAALGSSLLLISPENLRFHVGREWEGHAKVRAIFEYNGQQYQLVLTDPTCEAPLKRRPEGGPYPPTRPGPYWLAISLSEPLNDFAYKLVAGVIQAS